MIRLLLSFQDDSDSQVQIRTYHPCKTVSKSIRQTIAGSIIVLCSKLFPCHTGSSHQLFTFSTLQCATGTRRRSGSLRHWDLDSLLNRSLLQVHERCDLSFHVVHVARPNRQNIKLTESHHVDRFRRNARAVEDKQVKLLHHLRTTGMILLLILVIAWSSSCKMSRNHSFVILIGPDY